MNKTYERPTLTAAGSFGTKTGLLLAGGREVLVLRKKL